MTHIFNAMRPFAAREPGLAGAALVTGDVVIQVILDGVHLADDTARLVWQAAGGRVALVTDAIAAAGAGDGSYTLAGIDFEVENGIARRADSVLAGSTVSMIEAVRNLVTLGAPVGAALAAASEVPARIAGGPSSGVWNPARSQTSSCSTTGSRSCAFSPPARTPPADLLADQEDVANRHGRAERVLDGDREAERSGALGHTVDDTGRGVQPEARRQLAGRHRPDRAFAARNRYVRLVAVSQPSAGKPKAQNLELREGRSRTA